MNQIFIKIAGTDRSDHIEWPSVRWEQNLTNKTDLLSFRIRNIDGKTYAPNLTDEVELYIGTDLASATKKFGGHIVRIEETNDDDKVLFQITAKDYAYKLDSELVAKTYTGQTVNAIIADLITNYAPSGYTTNAVDCTTTIPAIKFNYLPLTRCIQQLAEITGYDWFVDENKDIHFFAKETNAAPFNITDSAGNHEKNTLRIRRNVDQLRNSIYVRGGEYLSSDIRTEDMSYQADGTNKHFKVAYRYKNYTLKVNGATKTVGIDNLDDPASYDALYNFNEKVIKFKTAPASTDTVTFEGNIYIPLRIKWKDNASISKYGGEFQFIIVDKTIQDIDEAKDRARAEILAYADQLDDGGFRTTKDGLRTGQLIQVQSTLRGSNDTFTITRITARPRTGGGGLRYEVTLADKQTTDFLDLMQKILLAKSKEIDITDDEVLTQVEGFIEDITWQETWTATTLPAGTPTFEETITFSESWRTNPWGTNTTPEWVAGPYFPTDANDKKRATFADSAATAS